MEFAFAHLQWAPEDFWKRTPHEFTAAARGWERLNGVTRPKYMTKDRLAELMEKYPDEKPKAEPDVRPT